MTSVMLPVGQTPGGDKVIWTPASKPGLKLLTNAKAGAGVGYVLDGANLAQMTDLSGSGAHITQSSGALQGVLDVGGMNGFDCFDLTGGAKYVLPDDAIYPSGVEPVPLCMFAVISIASSLGFRNIIDIFGLGGREIWRLVNSVPQLFSANGAITAVPTDGTPTLIGCCLNSDHKLYYFNGTTGIIEGATTDTPGVLTGSTRLYAQQDGGTNPFEGKIGAHAVWGDSDWSVSDFTNAINYFKTEWGLP